MTLDSNRLSLLRSIGQDDDIANNNLIAELVAELDRLRQQVADLERERNEAVNDFKEEQRVAIERAAKLDVREVKDEFLLQAESQVRRLTDALELYANDRFWNCLWCSQGVAHDDKRGHLDVVWVGQNRGVDTAKQALAPADGPTTVTCKKCGRKMEVPSGVKYVAHGGCDAMTEVQADKKVEK